MSALLTQDQCPQCQADQSAYQMMGAQPSFCLQCKFPLMLIAGKYPLQQVLSRGGQSTLYLARHHRLKRKAERVIKVLSHEQLDTSEAIKRFHREVQVTAELSQLNEHIVRIYDDFGEVPYLGYFYVMEYLQGTLLDDYLDGQRAPLPPAWALDIMMQLCDAIQVAHEAGVIHRDIKPQNLMLLERPHAPLFLKVLDWGIAKTSVEGTLNQALTQHAIGTPLYMAPEQVFNDPVDVRTDIYSMGILLFELLTGSNPFALHLPEGAKGGTERSMALAINAQIYNEPPSLKELLPRTETRPLLEAIVTKAMAKDPDRRYNDVEELHSALRGVANAMQFQLPSESAIELDAPFASGLDIPVQTPHSLDFIDAARPDRTKALPTDDKNIMQPLHQLHSLASLPENRRTTIDPTPPGGKTEPEPTAAINLLDDETPRQTRPLSSSPQRTRPLPTPASTVYDLAPTEPTEEANMLPSARPLQIAQTTIDDPLGRNTLQAIEDAYPEQGKHTLILWLSGALFFGALIGYFWWSAQEQPHQRPHLASAPAAGSQAANTSPATARPGQRAARQPGPSTRDASLPERAAPEKPKDLSAAISAAPGRIPPPLARPKAPARRTRPRRKPRRTKARPRPRKPRKRAPARIVAAPTRRPTKAKTTSKCHKGWRWVSVRPFLHKKTEVLTEGGKSRARSSSGICVSTSTWRMSVMQQGYALCIFKPKKRHGTLRIKLKPEDGLHSPSYCVR